MSTHDNPTENETFVEDATDDTAEQAPAPARKSPFKRIIGLLVLVAVLAVGGVIGYGYWQRMSKLVSTDDAYLSADITQISPQVSGTIAEILVEDNQMVKAGDLLVVLDDTMYAEAVAQAQANLDAAIAAAEGAGSRVQLTEQTGDAQITQAMGLVEQTQSSIAGANADLAGVEASVEHAASGVREAEAKIRTAEAAVEAARAAAGSAEATLKAANAQLQTARANADATRANVAALETDATQAEHDAARYDKLLADGVVSEQAAEQHGTTAHVADAHLAAARKQVEMAEATVSAREADVAAAERGYDAARASVEQAKAQLAAVQERAQASRADLASAEARRSGSREAVRQAQARRSQALGQLQQAQTKPEQVRVSNNAAAEAQARIEQAQAALDEATTRLSQTRIYAPSDGQIGRKSVEQGALVQVGTPLMAIVGRDELWVDANYKETQLAQVRVGLPVDLSVDALDGEHFKGHVESISAATGSTFALLPPENASGNFTKVVQRIPVRISVDPDQPDYDRLLAGMSVVAEVQLP